MKKNLSKSLVPSAGKPEQPEPFVSHTCKNCQYVFEGNFCPSCGQSVVEVQQPIIHFIGDLFGSVFALDIRLIRSIPILLLKPGRLSDEYIDGKRVSHVPPFRLYFFSSLIFFFLIGWQTRSALNRVNGDEAGLTAADSLHAPASLLQVQLNNDSIKAISNLGGGLGLIREVRQEIRQQLADSSFPAREKLRKQRNLKTLENPELLISKIYQYVSWSFFLLMPLFAFILYVVFRKKRRYYAEHLVYSVNLHTFFFMIAIVAVLLSIVFPALLSKVGGLIFLFTVVYSILGIRNFYHTRWISALLSSIGIFFIYMMCVTAILVFSVIIFLT